MNLSTLPLTLGLSTANIIVIVLVVALIAAVAVRIVKGSGKPGK